MRASAGDADLHWESAGAGPPVLLVMGLGLSAAAWWRTVPVLEAAGLRVLSFDNRGAGRSSVPPGPYSVERMAEDCVAVLDAAGERSAHVYGISLGGMIAQELALRHPDRVRSLVLGATTPGGRRAVALADDVRSFFERRADMPPPEAAWASVPYSYGPDTLVGGGARIAEDIAQRLRFPVTRDGYRAQLAAALSHSALERLPELRAPALVLHGDADQMVPAGNGELLAEAIPGASLERLPGAGHLYPTDAPHADRRVAEFLLSAPSSPGPS